MRRVTIGALTISLSLGVAIPLSAHLVSESTGTDPVHTLTPPTEVGLSTEKLGETRRVIESMILANAAPGAAIAIGRGPAIVLEEGFGRIGWSNQTDRVDPDETIYDLASLTKVVATTAVAMSLYEEGLLDLDARVTDHLDSFPYEEITFRHLLTHTSGLPAGIAHHRLSFAETERRVREAPLRHSPGSEVVYSDIGFINLWYALEEITGEPLPELLDRRIYGPLGMRSTSFQPGAGCKRCAPTKLLKSGRMVRGIVHDPLAEKLGGVAGHAGLFSTAHDLARFAAMLAAGGELDGVRIFQEETIDLFTRAQPGAESRALGWDTPSLDPEKREDSTVQSFSTRAFGHYGFTGTSLWIDPESGLWVVVLTNRVYAPRAPNAIRELRRTIHDYLALAVESDPPTAPALYTTGGTPLPAILEPPATGAPHPVTTATEGTEVEIPSRDRPTP